MPELGHVVVSIVLIAAAAAAPLTAAEPWIDAPLTADARDVLEAAEAVPAPPGAGVFVLYRAASYSFDAAGRTTYRQQLVYRLLTPQGVEGWSKIEVEWAPWHQRRPEVRARVLTPDGREHRLDASAITEGPAPGEAPDVVADRRGLRAPLPALTIGAVVEEEIVVRDDEPFFAAGTAALYPLQMFAPIHRGALRLAAPTSVPLRYGVRLAPGLQPRRRLEDGRVELIFDYRDMPAIGPIDAGLPSSEPQVAQVAFSTGESWHGVAASYSRLVDARIEDGVELDAFLGRLPPDETVAAAGALPAAGIAAVLAALRQEVRYTGLELGASSLVPASPGVTLERRFGDCKDQATLLVALLRRAGVAAYVALLNAGFGRDVEPGLPGIGRFNHAIVFVPSTPPLWIDPTDASARAGELPAADQNRWALIAGAETEKLLRTPSANSVDNLTVERREVWLADHGPGRVVETSVYHGEPERQQRRNSGASSEDSRREGYWEYVESTYLAAGLGDVEESDPDDLSQPFVLVLEALDAGRAVTDLAEAVLAIRRESLVASLPRALKESGPPRQDPYELDQPFVTEWRYRVHLPTGFVPRQLPADEERHFGSARFRRTARREDDGVVAVDLRFDSGPRHLTPETFDEMRRGVSAFLAEEPLLLWFDHVGAVALAEGRAREAVDQYRRFAELEGGKAIHKIRLAQALLRLGLAREAQRQSRLAVELEPESPLAYWSLGYALEHDEIGRRFSAGFDRDAARTALERAVELGPEDPLPRTELAILLEYDAAGRRYSEDADLAGAIAQYRLLRDELGVQNLEVNLVSALYWARRWDELYAATLKLGENPVSRYLHLVALAVLRGPEAAIREAPNLSPTANGELNLLTAAAQHLVIARRYREASALLEGAAAVAAKPEALIARARVLARARPHEELAIAAGTPGDLARSLLVALGRGGIDRRDLAELFHPQYVADRGDEETALEATLERMRQEQLKATGDLPVEAVLDLALAILEPAVDGDARLGFRVRMLNDMDTRDLASGSAAFRIYVTPFEGRLVIAAVEDQYGQIGKEVWRRLADDDLRGAHQWLDWARDAIAPVETDDPYGFRPFARYWIRGTGAFRDKMRLGAAILMADQPEAEQALPVLEEALATADDEATRRVVEASLLGAYGRLGDETRLASLAARLLEREPTSTLAFLGRCRPLLRAGRLPELEKLAQERLELMPGNPEALRYLVQVELRRSQAERAGGYFEDLRAAGRLSPSDEDLWAWLMLFRRPIPAAALELALHAAEESQYRDPAALHSLAAVYAEIGRPAEAHQALLRSLELRDDPAPTGDDWFVYGRVVEEYGFEDLAREYYGRLEPPPPGEVYTAFDLGARRLEALDGKGGKRRRSEP